MGNCLSSKTDDGGGTCHRSSRANVVSDTGELRQYSLPIMVSQVLDSLSSPDSFFLCNSDRLYFDQRIPALDLGEELQEDQIYFLLPVSRLQYSLAATDMAALAVKASVALEKINNGSSSSRRKKSKARILPVAAGEEDPQSNHTVNNKSISKKSMVSGPEKMVARSGSVRRLKRYSSRRAKLAVRSFRMKLSTISEGSSFRGTSS